MSIIKDLATVGAWAYGLVNGSKLAGAAAGDSMHASQERQAGNIDSAKRLSTAAKIETAGAIGVLSGSIVLIANPVASAINTTLMGGAAKLSADAKKNQTSFRAEFNTQVKPGFLKAISKAKARVNNTVDVTEADMAEVVGLNS